MEWWDLTEPDHDGGVLEFIEIPIELHVYERDGERHALWINDDATCFWSVEPGHA
jgi:hypothetical protein